MMKSIMNNVVALANEFIECVMEQNVEREELFEDIRIENSFSYDYDEETNEINTKATLLILNDDDDSLGEMHYNMKRDSRTRYTYNVEFKFNDYYISEDMEEFMEIKDVINKCDDDLYNKMCKYLHDYTMMGFDYGEDEDCGITGVYRDEYCPSKIHRFMKKFGISPYVPIDIEVVDDKGLPIKYLDIKEIGFNDEGNRLIIFLKES